MGLSGAGKTTYANFLCRAHENCEHLNADAIRSKYNDWDFSHEGRIRQAIRMRELADASTASMVIVDMICPLREMRKIISPDSIIFLDNTGNGQYKDTDSIFERPSSDEAKIFNISTNSVWGMPDVSCVMSTYRRFNCVERSIRMFLNQKTTANTELIILNTDTEYPLVLGTSLLPYKHKIHIINRNTELQDESKEYSNIGIIRGDALSYARGRYYICWDDDDVFLPWNIQQCFENIEKRPHLDAWKPFNSMYWARNEPEPCIAGNVMEASIISRTDAIRKIGFIPHQGGGEHLSWYQHLWANKKLLIDRNSIPAYSFNWHDTGILAGHKQSGSIDRVDNFTHHKENTRDIATRPLELLSDEAVKPFYDAHIKIIRENIGKVLGDNYTVSAELVDKYIK